MVLYLILLKENVGLKYVNRGFDMKYVRAVKSMSKYINQVAINYLCQERVPDVYDSNEKKY